MCSTTHDFGFISIGIESQLAFPGLFSFAWGTHKVSPFSDSHVFVPHSVLDSYFVLLYALVYLFINFFPAPIISNTVHTAGDIEVNKIDTPLLGIQN